MDENYMLDLEDLIYALIAVQNEAKRMRILVGRPTIHEYGSLGLNESRVGLLQSVRKVNTIINRINATYKEFDRMDEYLFEDIHLDRPHKEKNDELA